MGTASDHLIGLGRHGGDGQAITYPPVGGVAAALQRIPPHDPEEYGHRVPQQRHESCSSGIPCSLTPPLPSDRHLEGDPCRDKRAAPRDVMSHQGGE